MDDTDLDAHFVRVERPIEGLPGWRLRRMVTVAVVSSARQVKSEKLKQKVQSAMIYPAVVVSMAMLITIVLLVKVVPTFSQIYTSLGQKLPVMTQVLIDFSNLLQHQLVYLIAGGFILVGLILQKFYIKNTDIYCCLADDNHCFVQSKCGISNVYIRSCGHGFDFFIFEKSSHRISFLDCNGILHLVSSRYNLTF